MSTGFQSSSTRALRLQLPGSPPSSSQATANGNPTIVVLLVLGVLFVVAVAIALFRLPSTAVDSHIHTLGANTVSPPAHSASDTTGSVIAHESAIILPKEEYREFDLILQLQQGTLIPAQPPDNHTVRMFDLGVHGSDMDMLSLVLYTCCCNDHLVVICDGRTSDPSYAIQCFLSHNPNVPYHDSLVQRYKHEWRLLIQYGTVFEEKLAVSDCVFSARYHTTSPATKPPPPPLAPTNELAKKVWG